MAEILSEITFRGSRREALRKICMYTTSPREFVVLDQEIITQDIGPKKWSQNILYNGDSPTTARIVYMGLLTQIGYEIGNPKDEDLEKIKIASSQAYRNTNIEFTKMGA